jgi:hypothetical protein
VGDELVGVGEEGLRDGGGHEENSMSICGVVSCASSRPSEVSRVA